MIDLREAFGLLLFGGSLFLLGALAAMYLTFGPTLWWDAREDVDRDSDEPLGV